LIHLGDFGYKDVDIIQRSFEKLNQMLDERNQGRIHIRGPEYLEEVYGSYKNLMPKHYVYDGFQDNAEFKQHLTTLLEWKDDRQQINQEDLTPEVQELKYDMEKLLKAAGRLKKVQVEMQASIDNLRQQFFKLQEIKDQHAFMQENKYIRLEMLELEELLVEAGYIDPDEADAATSTASFKDRMDRATKIFYDYASQYSPELMSP
jgi:hypothetical protein